MRIERRKHQRYPLSLELRLATASGKLEMRLSDLSFGGCYIDSIGQAFVGEELSFEIKVPALDWVSFRGEVTYAHPGFGFGVRFAPLTSTQETTVALLTHSSATAAMMMPARQMHAYAA